MSNFGKVLVCLTMAALSTTGALAEMPEALKGSWILDAQATAKYIETSPKWKAEDAKYLPTVMKRMSQVQYVFEDDAIVVSMRGKRQALPVVLKESAAKKFVFAGTMRGKAVTMTVSIVAKTRINIRSSATDDGAYYLWKRGRLADNASASDSSLALEVTKKALGRPSPKPAADDSE